MKTPRWMTSAYLPIGLDLTATGAKLLQLRKHGDGLAVVDAMRVEAPAALDEERAQDRLAPILDALRRRWSVGSFRGRRCVIGVGQDMLRIRSIRQPRMPREEADAAVALEARDRLGFAMDQSSEIGWIRAGEVRQSDQLRDEVIVVGAPTSDLEWLIQEVSAMGLRPMAIEPSFVASARCFERAGRRAADESVTRLLIDIGFSSTDLIILRGSTIAFYKTLNVGGRRMNELVAERLGLDQRAAADLRRQRIQPGRRQVDGLLDERTEQAIFEAIRPVVDELAREIAMCVRYYAVSFTGARPQFALIVGGEAGEPHLVTHMERGIGLPTYVGASLEGVELGGALSGGAKSGLPEWSAAVGLSLRESDSWIERRPLSPSKETRAATDDQPEEAPVEGRNAA